MSDSKEKPSSNKVTLKQVPTITPNLHIRAIDSEMSSNHHQTRPSKPIQVQIQQKYKLIINILLGGHNSKLYYDSNSKQPKNSAHTNTEK